MKICYAVFHYDARRTAPRAYLDWAAIHRRLPGELAAMGHRVSVVHLFPTTHHFVEGEVDYHFAAAAPPVRSLARIPGRLFGHASQLYEVSLPALRLIRHLRPDLVHFHGTNLHLNLLLLRLALGRGGPPVVLHFHGGCPSSRRLIRSLQRFNFRRVSRFLFTTYAHARPFVDAGLLDRPDRVVELMETSSTFRLRPRADARRETGMQGDPVFLWTGRLHPVKDPLTALRGFEQILHAWPDAHLYLYYLTDELLPALRTFVDARPPLQGHVHFRGRAPFHYMEAIYNSADFLLQASRREFSGCAVLEAMACGVIPAVTDIPSFRAMTADGRHGVLFPPGDAEALVRDVLSVAREEIPARSLEVRARFEQALSFPALARRLEAVYREVLHLDG